MCTCYIHLLRKGDQDQKNEKKAEKPEEGKPTHWKEEEFAVVDPSVQCPRKKRGPKKQNKDSKKETETKKSKRGRVKKGGIPEVEE